MDPYRQLAGVKARGVGCACVKPGPAAAARGLGAAADGGPLPGQVIDRSYPNDYEGLGAALRSIHEIVGEIRAAGAAAAALQFARDSSRLDAYLAQTRGVLDGIGEASRAVAWHVGMWERTVPHIVAAIRALVDVLKRLQAQMAAAAAETEEALREARQRIDAGDAAGAAAARDRAQRAVNINAQAQAMFEELLSGARRYQERVDQISQAHQVLFAEMRGAIAQGRGADGRLRAAMEGALRAEAREMLDEALSAADRQTANAEKALDQAERERKGGDPWNEFLDALGRSAGAVLGGGGGLLLVALGALMLLGGR